MWNKYVIMKKSKRKIREAREVEKTFRVEYNNGVDRKDYWTLIHARNRIDAENFFNELYGSERAKMLILNIEENE
jgi:DNA-binding Lrp family transcriptional regulator